MNPSPSWPVLLPIGYSVMLALASIVWNLWTEGKLTDEQQDHIG